MRTTTARVQGSAAASSNCSRNNETGFSPIELGPTMSISSKMPSTAITATAGPPLQLSCRGTVNGWSGPEFPGVGLSLMMCPSAHTVELVVMVGAWQQPANSRAAKAKMTQSFCAKLKTHAKAVCWHAWRSVAVGGANPAVAENRTEGGWESVPAEVQLRRGTPAQVHSLLSAVPLPHP